MVTVCDCVAFLLNQNCWFLWETKLKRLVFCNTSVIIYYTAGLLLRRLVVRKHNYNYKRRVRSTWPAIGHQHFCFISHVASTWCWWLGVTNTIPKPVSHSDFRIDTCFCWICTQLYIVQHIVCKLMDLEYLYVFFLHK